MEIVKCLLRKDGVKMIIIPKHSKIQKGDFVIITNDLKMVTKFQKEEQKNG